MKCWSYVNRSLNFSVSECFTCYLIHQAVETGVFKSAVMPPSGKGILVTPRLL
jgi:hypothetical protein